MGFAHRFRPRYALANVGHPSGLPSANESHLRISSAATGIPERWALPVPVEWGVRRIYLDANATTPLLPEVLEAMRPFLLERVWQCFLHPPGRTAGSLGSGTGAGQRCPVCWGAGRRRLFSPAAARKATTWQFLVRSRPGDHVITSSGRTSCGAACGGAIGRARGRGGVLPVNGAGVGGSRGCTARPCGLIPD